MRLFTILILLILVSCNRTTSKETVNSNSSKEVETNTETKSIKYEKKPPKNSALVQIPNGDTIRVYAIAKFFTPKKSDNGLKLRYETNFPPKHTLQLQTEVENVWEYFQPIVEQNDYSVAYIQANEPIRGMFSSTTSFTYRFEKSENGNWKMKKPATISTPK